jgi:hypothetical protein
VGAKLHRPSELVHTAQRLFHTPFSWFADFSPKFRQLRAQPFYFCRRPSFACLHFELSISTHSCNSQPYAVMIRGTKDDAISMAVLFLFIGIRSLSFLPGARLPPSHSVGLHFPGRHHLSPVLPPRGPPLVAPPPGLPGCRVYHLRYCVGPGVEGEGEAERGERRPRRPCGGSVGRRDSSGR